MAAYPAAMQEGLCYYREGDENEYALYNTLLPAC